MTFEELKLAPAILKAVREQGYDTPTPIQAQAIPAVLEGHDLLGGAQTGTGKTAAFTLPMLHKLTNGRSKTNKFGVDGIAALVLTPTRELAAQVEESVRTYGKYLPLTSTVIFGGVGMNPQVDRMKRGVDILVATPGRLLDLQQQGFMDLSTVEMLVLDEADRMLDMGFLPDVKKVLNLLPREKQSLLFSATFSDEIRDLANSLLREPRSIQVTPRNTTVQRITQVVHPVSRAKKKQLLAHIIQEHDWSQVLVFTRTKFGANHVAEFLAKQGITAMALHGNKSQGARTQALAGFKSGEIRALVATDIAARGIDIDDLPHVVNFEIPNVPEDYVHRIGRTGRAGREGQAVSLVCLDEEGFMQEIERFTKAEIAVHPVEGFGPESGEKAEPIAMGRQTLWGGAGRPPSREVMNAAAKAARQEMMQRIRENKAGNGPRKPADGEARAPRNGSGNGAGNGQQRAKPVNGGRPPVNGHNGHNGFNGQTGGQRPPQHQARPDRALDADRDDREDGEERVPRNVDPLRTSLPTRRDMTGVRRTSNNGQPDPTRTSIDSMGASNRGNGGGGNRNRNRGGGGGGGGGGYGARGNQNRRYG
ncbi:DEAD/DEAH box helicase [Ramlibacter henchirensis]|uniref:ATP-dependent RNA helicase RhlE n=1 Tax=Ramlibacter henchirensis TaxID=204072 RepID=A0A4Z0C3Z0_9BURK|nr:DEAD/DEAH box helicase [Ramlibacter henchirensis]TFZ06243.1 DEAD/DEAH box helicase [Ramlibacter henchirensis]